MSSSANLQGTRFIGNKGFSDATPALLSRLVLKYSEIVANPATPATLRAYAEVVLGEVRKELSSRALREGQAA